MACPHLSFILSALADLQETEMNISLQNNKLQKILSLSATLLFLISTVLFTVQMKGRRRIFYFPVIGSERTASEIRLVSSDSPQGKVRAYVDELLLGPTVRRSRPLFSAGTKTEFCFLRGKKLYLNLSRDALFMEGEAAEINLGIKLLKENIKRNFSQISEIVLFIDGKILAEDEK